MRDESPRLRVYWAWLSLIGHFVVYLWDIFEKMGHFSSSDALALELLFTTWHLYLYLLDLDYS